MTSDLNSVISITYVPMAFWTLNTSMRWFSQGGGGLSSIDFVSSTEVTNAMGSLARKVMMFDSSDWVELQLVHQ